MKTFSTTTTSPPRHCGPMAPPLASRRTHCAEDDAEVFLRVVRHLGIGISWNSWDLSWDPTVRDQLNEFYGIPVR